MARPVLVVSALLAACSPPASGDPTLTITTTPAVMNAIARTIRVRVTATNPDGAIGQGDIVLTGAPGTLDKTEGPLDEFGTFSTTMVCPASDPECTTGIELRINARWRSRTPDSLVTASRSLRIGAPPSVFSVDNCPDEARLVYLFTDQSDLFSFHPPTKRLTLIGRLNCPTTARPNSMAVSQDGTAYLNYHDGKIYQVNVRSASCTVTSFVAPSGWTSFGMGFKPASSTSVEETLFIARGTLARVAIPSMAVTVIGAVPGVMSGPELSGTADGALYAYLPPPNSTGAMGMAKIDPMTAMLSNPRSFPSLTVAPGGFAYAFTAWGREFYLYTSTGGMNSSIVRYDPVTDTDSVHVPSASSGIRIVGAGVSRCGQ